jgi:cathepsin H
VTTTLSTLCVHRALPRPLAARRADALVSARSPRIASTPTQVKNQAHCGSCWTFSTSGCLESHVYLKTGHMPNISEQQLVDCAGAFNNNGCNGGLPSQAYEYIMYAGGIDSEDAYPYEAKTGPACMYKQGGTVAKVIGVVNITQGDEDELVDAVGTVGPVSIAFQVSEDFRFYNGGVYDGVCKDKPEDVNHAVVAVGFGTTDDGEPFWTVRNSWGAGWGEAGHFRIARGVNKCGIVDCASYPIV